MNNVGENEEHVKLLGGVLQKLSSLENIELIF